MSENVYNAGLPPRRHMGGGTIAATVSEASGLTRTRHFGSTSAVANTISQTASLVRTRNLYNDHSAVWTSGVYVRLDLPATPISLQDRADPSKWVLQVTNTGSATFKGGIAAASIDIPDTTTAASFHVDTTGKMWSGANVANVADALFTVTAAGALGARTANFYPKDSSSVALSVVNDKTSSANLLEMKDSPGGTTIFSVDGSLGTVTFGGGLLPGDGAVGSIAARQDNWNVASGYTRVRATLTGNQDLTGIVAVARAMIYLENADTADTLTLKHESANSTAANRFYLPNNADFALLPRQGVWLSYSLTDNRWHIASGARTTLATDTLWDALGDLAYGSGADTGAKLAGQTTTTKQFLSQTGNGSISAAPAWSTIDLSTGSVTGVLAAARFPALTGDVTTSAGAVATTIANNAVSYAKMQDVSATSRILGRVTAGAGDPEELTATQVGSLMVATDLPAHGAAQHTDITRTFFMATPENTINDGATNNTAGTAPDGMQRSSLADAATAGQSFKVAVPADWAGGAITYQTYWIPSATDATAHTVRWSADVLEVAAGTDVTGAGTTTAWTGSSAARTALQLVIEPSQTLATPTASGDILRFNLRRLGADAADTYVGTVGLTGVLFSYTSTQ